MSRVIDHLRQRGAHVDLLLAGAGVVNVSAVRPEHDLYVLTARDPLTHSLAGALEAAGARVVNTYRSMLLARDRVATTGVLAAAGIPVPAAWTAGQPSTFTPLLREGRLWLQAQDGEQPGAPRRLDGPAILDAIDRPRFDAYGYPLPVFAQRETPAVAHTLHIAAIGDRLWTTVRRWPARAHQALHRPLSAAIRSAALEVGRVLGLELYGVEVVVPHDGSRAFAVVDVQALPSYAGLVQAPAALADYLFAHARRSGARGAPACG